MKDKKVRKETPKETLVIETTDGFGSYGNPPKPPKPKEVKTSLVKPGEGLVDVLKPLKEYELRAHISNQPSPDDEGEFEHDLEEVQMILYRFITRMLRDDKEFKIFNALLDRADELPEVYDELVLTRVIANMIPEQVQPWYFKLLWLITHAANPRVRSQISESTNFQSLLQGMNEEQLEYITQYFAQVAVITK